MGNDGIISQEEWIGAEKNFPQSLYLIMSFLRVSDLGFTKKILFFKKLNAQEFYVLVFLWVNKVLNLIYTLLVPPGRAFLHTHSGI